MAEQFTRVSEDVEICFETFGEPSHPTVLLVMGLGTQMIAWHEDFCASIVERGFHVIRFDNRDCGRSSRIEGDPPGFRHLITRDKRAAHYRLSDMAADAIGLLDHLEIETAHVVGASMGGMIAQTLAIEHGSRVDSLVSIMSTTGNRWVGQPAMSALPVLLKAGPRDRDAFADHVVTLYKQIGSPDYPADEDEIRRRARISFDRGITAAGTGRQMAAVIASGDRTSALRDVDAPTLVIHGKKDKLVRPSGGKATAKAIPGAELKLVDGMGHDLPRALWPELVEDIVATARRAERAKSAA